MIVVRTALGGDVDLAHLAAELGRVDAGLDLEFLQGVDGGQEQVAVEVGVGIIDTVQSEIVPLAAIAGDGDLLGAPVAALARGGLAAVAEARAHVRAERDELQKVAPVQRQIHDALIFDDRADRGVLGVQQRSAGGDFDRFGHLSHPQLEIEARHLLHLQFDIAADRALKPLHADPHVVSAGQQAGKRVDARAVCIFRAGETGLRVGDGHCGANQHGSARVRYQAGNLAEGLGEQRRGQAHHRG